MMKIERGETRSLLLWLISQKNVAELWIDELLSQSPPESDFVRKLEMHRNWLAARIRELSGRAV